MRWQYIGMILATAAFCTALPIQETFGDDKGAAQLIAVDKAMQHSFLTRDVATLDAILTDDYLLVLSSGREFTKADVLADMRSQDSYWEINESSGWKVRVHGDMAIVVATLHEKGTDQGKAYDKSVKFSDTYVREKGRWRNIHSHISRPVDVVPGAG